MILLQNLDASGGFMAAQGTALRQRPMRSRFAGRLLLAAVFATAVATFVSISLILAYAAALQILFAIASGLLMPVRALSWLWGCAILIAPITLAFLPAAAIIGRRWPFLFVVLHPLLGLAGGIIVAKLWAIARDNHFEIVDIARNYISFEAPSDGGTFFILSNGLAGLAAGAIFSFMQTIPDTDSPNQSPA